MLLKIKSLNLSGQFLRVRLMCIILMELNYAQDCELGQVIYMSTSLHTDLRYKKRNSLGVSLYVTGIDCNLTVL